MKTARPPAARNLVERVAASKRAVVGFAVLGTLALLGIFADLVARDAPLVRSTPGHFQVLPTDPQPVPGAVELHALWREGPTRVVAAPFESPSGEHWLGTDQAGRDVLARLVHGARVALGTGLVVIFLGAIGGGIAGALASQSNRRIGQSFERVGQAVDAFPALIAVALFRAIEGKSSTISIVIGATIMQWATVTRLVRAEVQRLAAEDFIAAARALGASRARILLRHMIPHLAPGLASSAALGLAAVVLLEATLSFLGLGPPIAGASWGEMLAEGARNPSHRPLFVLPTVLLSVTIGAAYLVAEGVREASDPVALRLRAARERASEQP